MKRTKRLNRIIYRETLPPFAIALVVLTFVVFSREFGRLAELLIRKSAPPGVVLEVMASLLPSILIFTVPIGFLIGTLIGFSRLSTDSEIVAMRACGISLYRMLLPVLKVACAVTALTLFLTLHLLPEGNWHLRMLRTEISLRPALAEIKPRVFHEDLAGFALYVGDVDLQSGQWKGVLLVDEQSLEERRLILARTGALLFSPDGSRLQFHLEQGSIYTGLRDAPERDSISRFETLDLPVQLPDIGDARDKEKRPEDKTVRELILSARFGDPDEQQASRAELHARLALPLSALIFALLAVTLGTHTHQGGRGYGFILSMIIAFTYYVLFATGAELAESGVLPVSVGVWGTNLLLGLLAVISLYSAANDARLLSFVTDNRFLHALLDAVDAGTRRLRRLPRGIGRLADRRLSRSPSSQIRLARVADLYMIRTFLVFLAPTLLIVVGLFYLFTFFELIDDVFAHEIPYAVVIEYFLFLLPHILTLLVPISVLIATLMAVGSLERTNQIVAFKSCGVSVHRLAAPVLALSLLIGGAVFLMQEHILPYANQRQDNLRNIIKGRPAQTFYQPGRSWIFGQDDRLYNYNYYDPEGRLFLEFSVYSLDLEGPRLLNHVYSQKAQWDDDGETWRLLNGWHRDLRVEENGFYTFQEKHFPSPEAPGYFVQEVGKSSKMTYAELGRYIEELETAGLEVDHLKTELYKKLAFPAVNFLMVVLGIPFALSTGRKGALFGVAAGVVIGIVYWGAFGVFGVLGAGGLLAPSLAAWGPNILFGASAFLLLTTVET